MSDKKIIKNVTQEIIPIDSVGMEWAPESSFEIEKSEYRYFSSEAFLAEVSPYVFARSVVINDGEKDLSAEEGLRLLLRSDHVVIKKDGEDVGRVATEIDFTGANISVHFDQAKGKAQVSVSQDTEGGNGLCNMLLTKNLGMLLTKDLAFIKHKGL